MCARVCVTNKCTSRTHTNAQAQAHTSTANESIYGQSAATARRTNEIENARSQARLSMSDFVSYTAAAAAPTHTHTFTHNKPGGANNHCQNGIAIHTDVHTHQKAHTDENSHGCDRRVSKLSRKSLAPNENRRACSNRVEREMSIAARCDKFSAEQRKT